MSEKSIPKSMLAPRQMRLAHGSGQAWFYINRSGIEVYYSLDENLAAKAAFRISVAQLKRVIAIIEAEK